MKAILRAAVAATLIAAPAAAQDLAAPAAIDLVGQAVVESMASGPGVFVTAQGRAPMPAAAAPMTLTIKGTGKTAGEAVADRNVRLERIRSAANRSDVAMDVGETTWAISETQDWSMTGTAESPVVDYSGMNETEMANAAVDAVNAATDDMAMAPIDPPMTTTVTASTTVKLERPNETRLPGFIDALVGAGVTELNDGLNGLNPRPMRYMSVVGPDTVGDPGEAVWNAATADAVARARAQAEAVASASGRRLGPVRYVSVLTRSPDGEGAVVSVAVRFGFAE